MFILFQKIWVFLIVDVFLILILLQIVRKKMEGEKVEDTGERNNIIKQRGAPIYFRFKDKNGKNQEGEINFYPSTFGRSKTCDIVIQENSKQGHYYLSRKFITIMAVNQEFRVIRVQKENTQNLRFLCGTADGFSFDRETNVKFRETLELKITKDMTLYLKKKEPSTGALL